MHRFPKPDGWTIAGSAQNAVAGRAHSPENGLVLLAAAGQRSPRQGTKKAPDDAGAFVLLNLRRRSVLRDERATPVEVVGQLAADGVDELLGVERVAR